MCWNSYLFIYIYLFIYLFISYIYIFNYNLTTVQSGHLQFLYIFYTFLTNSLFPEGIFFSYIFPEGGGGVYSGDLFFYPRLITGVAYVLEILFKKKISTKCQKTYENWFQLYILHIFFFLNCTNIICFAFVLIILNLCYITFYLLV